MRQALEDQRRRARQQRDAGGEGQHAVPEQRSEHVGPGHCCGRARGSLGHGAVLSD